MCWCSSSKTQKTNTLYLSDHIDVSSDTSPRYFQIQVGLYIAILPNALDRFPQVKEIPESDLLRAIWIPEDAVKAFDLQDTPDRFAYA